MEGSTEKVHRALVIFHRPRSIPRQTPPKGNRFQASGSHLRELGRHRALLRGELAVKGVCTYPGIRSDGFATRTYVSPSMMNEGAQTVHGRSPLTQRLPTEPLAHCSRNAVHQASRRSTFLRSRDFHPLSISAVAPGSSTLEDRSRSACVTKAWDEEGETRAFSPFAASRRF